MNVAPPTTRYVEVDDVQLAYQVLGDGPIDLVFHHGFCHLDLQWDVAAEAAFNRRLASFSRLILFDRRGTGASERLHRGAAPTLDDWTADLLAVLDAVESESAALFVEAEAGPVAINFVDQHPERVQALVLANTAARFASVALSRRGSDSAGCARASHACRSNTRYGGGALPSRVA